MDAHIKGVDKNSAANRLCMFLIKYLSRGFEVFSYHLLCRPFVTIDCYFLVYFEIIFRIFVHLYGFRSTMRREINKRSADSHYCFIYPFE